MIEKNNNNGKNMCWKSKFFAYTLVFLRKIKKSARYLHGQRYFTVNVRIWTKVLHYIQCFFLFTIDAIIFILTVE